MHLDVRGLRHSNKLRRAVVGIVDIARRAGVGDIDPNAGGEAALAVVEIVATQLRAHLHLADAANPGILKGRPRN